MQSRSRYDSEYLANSVLFVNQFKGSILSVKLKKKENSVGLYAHAKSSKFEYFPRKSIIQFGFAELFLGTGQNGNFDERSEAIKHDKNP